MTSRAERTLSGAGAVPASAISAGVVGAEIERGQQPGVEDGALAEELGVIGQRAQPRVLHALHLVRSFEDRDRLLRLLSGLLAGARQDVPLLLSAVGKLERDLFGARGYLRAHRQRPSVGKHDRIELQEDVVKRREVTAEHREGAPLLRHCRASLDVAQHSCPDGNDDAIVGEDGIDQHCLDVLTHAPDDHPAVQRDPQRRALFHDEPERRVVRLRRCGRSRAERARQQRDTRTDPRVRRQTRDARPYRTDEGSTQHDHRSALGRSASSNSSSLIIPMPGA